MYLGTIPRASTGWGSCLVCGYLYKRLLRRHGQFPRQETKILLFGAPCPRHCPAHTLSSSQHDRKCVRVHAPKTSARDGSGCSTQTTGGELGRRACGVKCRKHKGFWDSVCLGPPLLSLQTGRNGQRGGSRSPSSMCFTVPPPPPPPLSNAESSEEHLPHKCLVSPSVESAAIGSRTHTPVPPGFLLGQPQRGVTSVREQSSLPG